ncbi:Mov34/MPN/PAD-1 family protein [Rossellomorea sp. GCM10028870]
MIDHGKRSLPYEACGILSGNQKVVKSIWKLQNELQSDRRFFISRSVIENTLIQIEELNQEVLAIYHTHPTTSPKPSYYDIRSHTDPAVMMVIVSFKTSPPQTKWYKVTNGNVNEYLFTIEPIS